MAAPQFMFGVEQANGLTEMRGNSDDLSGLARPHLNKRLASGWRANPVTQGVTLAINTQLVIASLRCAPQAQGLQRRQLAPVMPTAIFQPRPVGNFHSCTVTAYTSLFQHQPLLGHAVVFLPADLFNGVIPCQREV